MSWPFILAPYHVGVGVVRNGPRNTVIGEGCNLFEPHQQDVLPQSLSFNQCMRDADDDGDDDVPP